MTRRTCNFWHSEKLERFCFKQRSSTVDQSVFPTHTSLLVNMPMSQDPGNVQWSCGRQLLRLRACDAIHDNKARSGRRFFRLLKSGWILDRACRPLLTDGGVSVGILQRESWHRTEHAGRRRSRVNDCSGKPKLRRARTDVCTHE